MYRYRRWMVSLLLWIPLWGGAVSADPLSELSGVREGGLQPIPQVDLSGAERLLQEAIEGQRGTVADLLEAGAADLALLADAYGRLGALYQLAEVNGAAAIAYGNAHTLQPDLFRWPYYLGYLALRSGRSRDAVGQLEAAERLEPGYPPLKLRLGEAWLELSELERAQGLFEQAATHQGLRAAALYYLGQIAILRHRYDQAAAFLTEALQIAPEGRGAHYPLAQAYRAMGRDDLAREHLARFVAGNPVAEDPLVEQMEAAVKRSTPLFGEALEAVRSQDYARAVERFRAGLAVDPGNGRARISYARVLYLSGDQEAARGELERVLAGGADQPLALFLLAVLDEGAGDAEAAEARYRRVVGLEPGHAGAHFALASRAFRAERYAEAADHYAVAYASDHGNTPAKLLGLVARIRVGASEAEAVRELERAAADTPDQPLYRYALGRLLAAAADPEVRDPQRAFELASTLVQEQPIPPHLELLALACAARGDYAKAQETQGQLMFMAWMAPPGQQALLQREMVAYREGRVPLPAWPVEDATLQPPPLDPYGIFRDYPAAIPY